MHYQARVRAFLAFYSLVSLALALDVDLPTALDAALARYEARIAASGHSGSANRELENHFHCT